MHGERRLSAGTDARVDSMPQARGDQVLAPYAVRADSSRGRRIPEPPPAYRSEFQRDRDRILHSAAFRRLEYKTQVFVNHEGDMFRTRLTHSLEVAQIARTVAGALGLNETVVEAIALAHDLGHTPFGHAGQRALDACMREHGGFEHNLQSLRVVDLLEDRYAQFRGLNLSFEVREGILKHCRPRDAAALAEIGRRFLEGTQPSLEAQLANVADEIAYNNHDIDDGLRSGLIELEQVAALPLFEDEVSRLRRAYPRITVKQLAAEAIRAVINREVTDLIEHTAGALSGAGVGSVDAVRRRAAPLVGFSAELGAAHQALKRFLRRALYEHPRVRGTTERAAAVVTELFEAYIADPALLPGAEAADGTAPARRVADYVAGMTDRFALAEHARLLGA